MATLVGQYEEYPSVPLQEPSAQDNSNSNKYGGIKKYIYAGIVLAVIVIVAYLFLFSGSNGKNSGQGNLEGNKVCDSGENCIENPIDCKCSLGEVCSAEIGECIDKESALGKNQSGINDVNSNGNLDGNKICDEGENCFDDPVDCKCAEEEYCSDDKLCVSSVCGNGKCELYEGPDNCCIDCECLMPDEMCHTQTRSCGPLEIGLSEDRALEIATNYFEGRNISSESIVSEGVYRFGDKLVRQFSAQVIEEGYTARIGISETEEVVEIPTM